MATPWCETEQYPVSSLVTYNNFLWIAIVANIANPPASSPFWQVVTTEGETATVALTDFSTGEQVLVTL